MVEWGIEPLALPDLLACTLDEDDSEVKEDMELGAMGMESWVPIELKDEGGVAAMDVACALNTGTEFGPGT